MINRLKQPLTIFENKGLDESEFLVVRSGECLESKSGKSDLPTT